MLRPIIACNWSEKLTSELDIALVVPDLLRTLGELVNRDRGGSWNGAGCGRCQKGGSDDGSVMHLDDCGG